MSWHKHFFINTINHSHNDNILLMKNGTDYLSSLVHRSFFWFNKLLFDMDKLLYIIVISVHPTDGLFIGIKLLQFIQSENKTTTKK